MENQQEGPSLNRKENQQNEDLEIWSFDFPFRRTHPKTKNTGKMKQDYEILKDCIYEPDNSSSSSNNNNILINSKNNVTTSCLDDKSEGHNLEQCSPGVAEKDTRPDNQMEMVDLSDLTFSSNDLMLDDCNCFEQASQLVDPTIKDSDSTLFSFNNSDSVQLFRFSLPESTEDSLSNLVKYSDNILNKNSDESNATCERVDSNVGHCHACDSVDHRVSANKEGKSGMPPGGEAEKGRKKNQKSAPIKKGRRYMASFKQKVLEYTKNHTFKETALHFKISCNTITEWSRESKRLSLQSDKTSMPGSDCKNYKTDLDGTPESKTEIILLNDVIHFETDFNEPSMGNLEKDLPPAEMRPDERFIKWVETRRLQRKQLTRQEVLNAAKCCLRKCCPPNHEKPSWFVLYLKRFSKALKNSVTNLETEKYIKYPVSFKLEVAFYARIFTKNSAARVFNVPRKRIFDWVNCLNPLKDSFASNGGGGPEGPGISGQVAAFAGKKGKIKHEMYMELHMWYQKMFLSGAGPTSHEIKDKAREIFSAHGIAEIKFSDGWLQKFCRRMNIKLRNSEDDRLLVWVLAQLDNNVSLSHQEITEKSSSLVGRKKFKGSKGWTLRFLKRHRNLLQSSPTVDTELPQIVQDKLNYFWDSFRQSLITYQIDHANLGCMDEIPLSFNYPEDGKSEGLPLLRKTGFESCQGVVLLCTLACGRVLPPAVVFKGTRPKQLLSDRNVDILILYQEKGFVTVDVLHAWFNDIWLSCVPTPNALVVDSFEPHSSVRFRQLAAAEKCLLHVIPEGCSSRFQPLGVEVTPLFKDAIKKQWREFSGNLNSKLMRRYRCPDESTVLGWVQNAFERINRNPENIKREKSSCKTRNISNSSKTISVPIKKKYWFVGRDGKGPIY